MDFIIDYYKSLDTLNLIIFWGIIIVVILLLIFSCILLNKNKKLKKIVEKTTQPEEELPIKKIEMITENNEIEKNNNVNNISPIIEETSNENNSTNNIIETEKKFIAEEHIIGYKSDNDNILKEETKEYKIPQTKEFEIPSKPYQRNVLREMSLSQTSPIGITRPKEKEDRKVEMAKELQDSLNTNQDNKTNVREITNREKENIKKELNNIKNTTSRKTEIATENISRQKHEYNNNPLVPEKNKINIPKLDNYNEEKSQLEESIQKNTEIQTIKITAENISSNKELFEERKNNNYKKQKISKSNINEELIAAPVKELLYSVNEVPKSNIAKSSSEKYLEEVSKKLSEAEIYDDVERTDYELEQEENAIISYKELMEKKDSIQTIDEEEAIISIEELMSRNNKQEDNKLYNITEEEENDEFLKQLKQFRNDL